MHIKMNREENTKVILDKSKIISNKIIELRDISPPPMITYNVVKVVFEMGGEPIK